MALIVEDGTGLADAESYISVADADAYFLARGNATWAALTNGNKEAYLRQGTDYMVQMYRSLWAGERMTSTQALDWPRIDVPSPDITGAFVPTNVVPLEVKRACAELGVRVGSGALAPDETRAVLSEKIGVIAVEYDKYSPAGTRYRAVDAMVAVYFNGSIPSMSIRLVRS
jgi:hypothetical protein